MFRLAELHETLAQTEQHVPNIFGNQMHPCIRA